MLVAAVAWSALGLQARHGGAPPIGVLFGHFLGVMFVFNLFDLVVIDWLMLLVLRPAFLSRLTPAGVSYEETVGGHAYHFRAFFKGIGFRPRRQPAGDGHRIFRARLTSIPGRAIRPSGTSDTDPEKKLREAYATA